MNLEYTISYEPPLVVVQTAGIFDFLKTYEMWEAIVASCKANDCPLVLGVSNLSEPIPSTDAFELANIFKSVGINDEYRIAWATEAPALLEKLRLAEVVVKKQGSKNHRIFNSVAGARHWLMEEGQLMPTSSSSGPALQPPAET